MLNFGLLPLVVYGRRDYQDMLKEARKRIEARDPDDVDLLALALKRDASIWSNDKDFEVAKIRWFTTEKLLNWLEKD
jgi:predicted nucleic acid-binding protein